MSNSLDARLNALASPRALLLSGGGGNGAAQAAAVAELFRGGYRPDLILGTSIGAWNGAVLALDPTPEGAERLGALWNEGALFQMARPRAGRLLTSALFITPTLISDASIRRALARTGLDRARWSELKVPFVLGAVDAATFQLKYWDQATAESSLGTHVSACSALVPLLPFGRIGGREYVDAGMQDNYGIPEAVHRMYAPGARQNGSLLVIDCAPSVPLTPPQNPSRATDVALGATFRRHRDDGVALARNSGFQVEIIEVGGDHCISDYMNPRQGQKVGVDAVHAWAESRNFYPHWADSSLLRRVANVVGFVVKDAQIQLAGQLSGGSQAGL